jgi:thiol-disulfide isomerase/thioredoxin
MKLKTIFLLYIFTVTSHLTFGQQKTIKPLNIGDHIPDFVFRDLQNTAKSTRQAPDLYHPGLLIINFWATWCVPCVREMPFLDQLQAKYSDKLQVVSVTNESEQVLNKFLKNHQSTNHLLFLAHDTLLKKYFPHTIVPHNIWVDKNGIIRAITDDDQVNEKNIIAFLSGHADLHTKQDDLKFDWRNPLSVADTEFMYRSVIAPQKSNIGNGGVLPADSTALKTRFLAWNRSKTDLLWAAYMRKPMQKRDWKLVEIHTKDSIGFFYPSYTNEPNWTRTYGLTKFNEWAAKNLFCYELAFSKKIYLDDFYSLMANELDLFFHVKVSIENRPTDCWAITRLPSKLEYVNPDQSERKPLQISGTSISAKNQTPKEIADQLSEMYSNQPPFIDLTGTSERISLNKDFGDLSQGLTVSMIKSYLNSVGFDINLKKIKYPFLIIDDQR